MTCPSCQGELPDTARFCLHCGAPTGPVGSSPARRADERKVVSVLFCDLVGSTALSRRLDPEALRAITLRYFELMTGRVEAQGGRVEKFIGDAVMAVFGIPAMQEDDARRALAAALDMRTVLAGLNAGLSTGLGVRLDVRIGVNTGEVVTNADASARQALVSGEVVNVAARLEQNAAPGQILIGPDTLRAAGPAAVVESAGALALRGRAEPLQAYRLLGLRADDPELSRRFDTPFVGRERELAELDEALARSSADPEGRLVVVLGEAGLGKTRLVREWLHRTPARRGFGRCRPYGEAGSLSPLADALRQLLADTGRSDETGAAETLRNGLLHDGTPGPSAEDTCATIVQLLTALSRRRPVVVVLDDFHWATPVLRETVLKLAAALAGRPVLLLCLARLELLDQGPELTRGRHQVQLTGLSPTESARLAQALAEVVGHPAAEQGRAQAQDQDQDQGRARARAQVLRRAEGNPFHLEQLLAMTTEQRTPEGLPPTLQALLGARIDALDPAERTALTLAAVVGREFHGDELARLADSGPEGGPGGELQPDPAGSDPVRSALHRLARRRLVEPDGRAARYRFSSGLVQEAAYQGTAKRVRAERHERVARLLADRAAPDSLIGGHLARAHRYRGELGLLDSHGVELRRRAAAHLAAAGAQALARADLGWADELLTEASTLARPGEPDWLPTTWRLAEVRLATGRTEEGRRLLRRVAAAGPPVLAAHARLALAVLDPGPALEHATRTAGEVLPLFEAADDSLGIARACLRLAQHQQLLGRHGAAESLLSRALDHAVRADAEPERAAALGAIGVSLWLGPVPVPVAVARCRALLAEHGTGRRTVQVTLNLPLAVLLALRADWAGAQRCLDEARRVADQLGFAEARAFLPVFEAEVALLADRPAEAVELLRAAETACHELGATALLSAITRDLPRALLAADDHPAALAALTAAGPAPDDAPPPPADAAALHGALARLRAASAPADASALAERALADAARTDSPVVRATAALDRALTALAVGDRTRAVTAARLAARHFAAKGHLVGAGWAAGLESAEPSGPSGPTPKERASR
ncbi:AAA family ATPase [Kitasatospora sp. HPMI-4]|uniref:AAA family ATPase n=1 Tax=Kitasatospora sp. HPMI-4 TaxID=3448443 RepID=UPI003F1BDA2A